MKLFLFLLFFSFINLYSIDFEFGVKGGILDLYSGDANLKKRIDRYDLYNYEVKKRDFPKNLDLHPQWSIFFKYFTSSGKFGLNANYSSFDFSKSYLRRDLFISAAVLDSIQRTGRVDFLNFNSSFDLLTRDNFSITNSRKDYFLDSIYYFQPKHFGIGLGYRSIEETTNYYIQSSARLESVKDTREYKSMGGQISVYYTLPIEINKVELQFRGSYFDLGGKFSESFQQFGTSNAINQQPGVRGSYSYFTLGTQVGNPLVHRRGYEFDMLLNFSIAKSSENFRLICGLTYQESQLSILNYSRVTANLLNTPGYSASTEMINSLLVSKFIYSPAYSSPVIDRIYSIYFGISYRFESNSQVTN